MNAVCHRSAERTHGHAKKDERAVEVQRWRSDATFTVNLLMGVTGIKYFNIISGASNTLSVKILEFFDECSQIIDPFTGVSRSYEPPLREWLKDYGVALVFQPKYSPDMNPAEYCFVKLKTLLKVDSDYTYDNCELAIDDAISCISTNDCIGLTIFESAIFFSSFFDWRKIIMF
eukprot:Lithocolla_globosa_v1_NODE_3220_length_1729_cov_4.575269.p1 type:complete len:174 gc:universal NODE_3220_length_1729_cov_4.575269:272-793(+)